MSNKLTLLAACLLLCALSFGLGHYVATPARLVPLPATSPPLPVGAEDNEILAALAEKNAFEKYRKLATLLPSLGAGGIPKIRQALDSFAVNLAYVEYGLLLRGWALHAPVDAAKWAATMAPRAYQGAALVPAMEIWAGIDPMAAGAAGETLMIGESDDWIEVHVAIVNGWFDSGQPGLESYIRDGADAWQQRALRVLARRIIRRDGPDAVMRWAESLPDEPWRFKLAASHEVATELTTADPALGVAWCVVRCEGKFGEGIRRLVGVIWAKRDGKAALEWLSGAPAGPDRDLAVRYTYRSWLGADRDAATGWAESIGRLESEPWFGAVAMTHAIMVAEETGDFAEAMRWAEIVVSYGQRQETYAHVARRWRRHDEAAAAVWIDQAPLSEGTREMLAIPLSVGFHRPEEWDLLDPAGGDDEPN